MIPEASHDFETPFVKTDKYGDTELDNYYDRRNKHGDYEVVYRIDNGMWRAAYRPADLDNRGWNTTFATPQEAFDYFGMGLPEGLGPESPWKRSGGSAGLYGPQMKWTKYALGDQRQDQTVYLNHNGAWVAMTPGWLKDDATYFDSPEGAFGFFGDDAPEDAPEPRAKPPSLVEVEPVDAEGTEACPATSVRGVLYHGTALDLDRLEKPPPGDDPFWRQHGGDAPAIYLTEDYPTAVLYADSARYKCRNINSNREYVAREEGTEPPEPLDCQPRVYQVDVSMDTVANCEELIQEDSDEALREALPQMASNIREADSKELDGIIIPATYPAEFRGERALPNAPEYLTFNPEQDTKIIGVRMLGQRKEWDRGEGLSPIVEEDYVDTKPLTMPQPNGQAGFFEPVQRAEIAADADIIKVPAATSSLEHRAAIAEGVDVLEVPEGGYYDGVSIVEKRRRGSNKAPAALASKSGRSARGPAGKQKGRRGGAKPPGEIRRFAKGIKKR